ncbi:molybdopterin-binding protein [soil metagenome]
MNQNLPPLKESSVDSTVLQKKTRRAFFGFGAGIAVAAVGLKTLLSMEEERGIPWLLRRVNDVSDAFWHANFRKDARIATAKANGKPFRVNGDVGLVEGPIDAEAFRLTVIDPNHEKPLSISLEEIRKLPVTSMGWDFKCIEGWSQAIECKGVKLSDFMTAYKIGGGGEDEAPLPFVGLSSLDGGYYVSMDAKSFWHPQTLLCYEINGEPLKSENGAPLRLMTAVKYGVKNIKQLAKIEFTTSLPADYWAENGYQDTLMF